MVGGGGSLSLQLLNWREDARPPLCRPATAHYHRALPGGWLSRCVFPQAVLEAYGGCMSKLPKFLEDGSLESYTHLKTKTNLDFVPNAIELTLSNAKVELPKQYFV